MKREQEKALETLSPFEVKNTLMALAERNHDHAMINAGRGNPNWVATTPRHAFFQLGLFALEESERSFSDYDKFGGICLTDGLSERFDAWCQKNQSTRGAELLRQSVEYATHSLNMNKTAFLQEWVDGMLADNYPVPDRMLKHSEAIVHKYILQEMAAGLPSCTEEFDIFAVEGGTAAMVYIFNSLKSNGFLKAGDKIAIGSPIFTPYLEMPELEDYQLEIVEIMASEDENWQIPQTELDKLHDPEIKAFFLVNPSNPPSVKLSQESLEKIAEISKQRPDLILLTDDVYGTFTDEFVSLTMLAPKSTILVYSFSKYFGATGWRLGVIALGKDNNFDLALRNTSDSEKLRLQERYHGITLDVPNLKFIDRLVADSRAVALNHTAGLSTPQQIQMVLFSLFCLLDTEDDYKNTAKSIIKERYDAVFENTKHKPIISPDNNNNAFYYVEIDIKKDVIQDYGNEFFVWLEQGFEPLDFLVRLAENYGIVSMDGTGFDAPEWTLRLSLANLNVPEYHDIRIGIDRQIKEYYAMYQDAHS